MKIELKYGGLGCMASMFLWMRDNIFGDGSISSISKDAVTTEHLTAIRREKEGNHAQ